MHHQYHWRSKGDGVSVNRLPVARQRGNAGFFSKYLRCQLVRCHSLFSLSLNVCVLAWLFAG